MTGIDTSAESRAWAAARNVPDDVMTEHEFLHGEVPPIPGLREHTEQAVRRIAHNSIVALDAREQAMGDLEQALGRLFTPGSDWWVELPLVRTAWQAYKAAIS
jgi:hypothetical protein